MIQPPGQIGRKGGVAAASPAGDVAVGKFLVVGHAFHSRQNALREASDQAQRLGADAVVGLSIDFEVIGNRGAMIMVTATGTAVRLRKL